MLTHAEKGPLKYNCRCMCPQQESPVLVYVFIRATVHNSVTSAMLLTAARLYTIYAKPPHIISGKIIDIHWSQHIYRRPTNVLFRSIPVIYNS